MLLEQAIPGTDLECVFELGIDQVTITVSVVSAQPRMPARDTFAWTVLSALAGTVDSRLGPDQVTITVSVTAAQAKMPAKDTFAWTVLSALAGSVDSRLGPDDRVSIVLQKRRGASGSG